MTANPPFPSLLRAMTAIVQRDGAQLSEVLAQTAHDALYRTAVRHKCAGFLLSGIDGLGLRSASISLLVKELKAYCRSAMLQSLALSAHLQSLVTILGNAAIPCVLLKGAARMYSGEAGAHWNHHYDLDLLIRKSDAQAAVAALLQQGYENLYSADKSQWYRNHHHLCPLFRPGDTHSVELHTALGSPEAISLRTDWDALWPYCEPIGNDGMLMRLNRLATALHLAIHGVGCVRLYDSVLLAQEIRNDPSLVQPLTDILTGEKIQRIPLAATVLLAAMMAGQPRPIASATTAYASWAVQRESLPAYLRTHAQFVEAWFANGGTLFGPATRLAIRESTGITKPFNIVGRAATSVYAAAYSAGHRKR